MLDVLSVTGRNMSSKGLSMNIDFTNHEYISYPLCYRLENITKLELDFSHSKIDKLEENMFSDLPELSIVIIRLNNRFKSLPKNLFAFNPKIEQLIIGGGYFKYLPDKLFSRLKNLRELTLKNNKLRCLPNLNNPLLTLLDASINNIKKINIKGLPMLNDLNLSRNLIYSIPKDCFSNNFIPNNFVPNNYFSNNYFSNKYMFKKIDLSNNMISYIDGKCFRNRTYIDSLSLSNNRLNSFFIPNITVSILDISFNNIRTLKKEDISCFKDTIEIIDLSSDFKEIDIEPKTFKDFDNLRIIYFNNTVFELSEDVFQDIPEAYIEYYNSDWELITKQIKSIFNAYLKRVDKDLLLDDEKICAICMDGEENDDETIDQEFKEVFVFYHSEAHGCRNLMHLECFNKWKSEINEHSCLNKCGSDLNRYTSYTYINQ